MSRRAVFGTCIAVLGLLASACGIPLDSVPQELAIPASEEPGSTTTTTSAPDPEDASRVQLFFIQDGLLRSVTRQIAESVSNQSVFDALISGPTEAERDRGFETRLPEDLAVQAVLAGELLTVNILSEGGLPFEGEFLIAATAQMVFVGVFGTGANRVLFQEAGEFIQLLNGAGELQELGEDGVPIPLQTGDFDELRTASS